MKKVSFFVNLSETSEGRTKLVLTLKKALEKQRYSVVFNDFNADIIHVHSSGVSSSFLINKFRKNNAKCIYTLYSAGHAPSLDLMRNFVEDIISMHKEQGLSRMLKCFVMYMASNLVPIKIKGYNLKKFDKVVVLSDDMKEKLFSNTVKISAGVDTKRFSPKGKKKNNKRVIAYVGRCSSFKGAFDFEKAVRYLKELDDCDVRYYHKHIEDISKVYKEIDILVYPLRNRLSAIENPLVLLEAMASGCAVVTTDLPNIKEITGGCAYTVSPRRPDEITSAICEVGRDDHRRKGLGRKARQRILEHYDGKRMIKDYLELYRSLED